MAPEQYFTPHDVDIRADIFALGCTLFALLVGHPPFAGRYRNVQAKMEAHRDQPVESFRDLRPDVPIVLEEVILWTMAKNREDRFETPAELATSLSHFSGGHDLVQLLDTAEGRADPREQELAPTSVSSTQSPSTPG
jgi:serine/threonine protein kinase